MLENIRNKREEYVTTFITIKVSSKSKWLSEITILIKKFLFFPKMTKPRIFARSLMSIPK